MTEKTYSTELTEQDSSLIIVALELRERDYPPHSAADRRRLPELKKELTGKHHAAFIGRGRKPKRKEVSDGKHS